MTQTIERIYGATKCPKCGVLVDGFAQSAERLAEILGKGMAAVEHHNEPCKKLASLVDPSGLPDAADGAA